MKRRHTYELLYKFYDLQKQVVRHELHLEQAYTAEDALTQGRINYENRNTECEGVMTRLPPVLIRLKTLLDKDEDAPSE